MIFREIIQESRIILRDLYRNDFFDRLAQKYIDRIQDSCADEKLKAVEKPARRRVASAQSFVENS